MKRDDKELKRMYNKLEQRKTRDLKKDTMSLSIKEGCFASASFGLGDSYIIPYVLALNFNNFQVGLLKSLFSLFPPIFQYYGSKLMETWKRKKILIKFVTLQALMWFVLIAFPFLYWKGLLVDYVPYLLILSYTLLAVFGAIALPSWFSLLGDIVPDKIRGRYFSKRNRICESVFLVAFLIAAFILDFFKTRGLVLTGFIIIFVFAGIFRFVSSTLFVKHYEPRFKAEDENSLTFTEFIKGFKKINLARFSFFSTLFHFSIMLAGPFFAVYMLKDLGFSYTTFMIVSLSASVFSLLSLPMWGKLSDRYGTKKIMTLGTLLISVMPIFWIFSKSPVYLALIPQFFSGVGWAAFTLTSTNFIYDATADKEMKRKRGFLLSYNNILVGLGSFIGALIGGLLAQYIPVAEFSRFLIIFAISGALRLISVLIFLPGIKEVRKVKRLDLLPDIHLLKLRMHPGLQHQLISFRKIEKEIERGIIKFTPGFIYRSQHK